jgi:CubicO group peptidase (beta-lactamase class C family)
MDANGNIIWRKQIGNAGAEEGCEIEVTDAGNIFLTGGFSQSITFGINTYTALGIRDVFIAKLDNNGNDIWSKVAGSSSDDVNYAIGLNQINEDICTVGTYSGNFTDGVNSITSTGSMDSYISKLKISPYDFSPITNLITNNISTVGPDCGFMIIRGNTVIYKNYWGSWDDNTYQPIGSGSKMASMALLMKLIDEGYLSPNDTVQNFLPSFNGKPIITLHQLMNHTSGLPGNSSYISDNNISLQQAVDNIGNLTPMTSYAPGTAFQYGGVSMHVAGRMAEIATGLSWDTLFNQKIAIPLEMNNTDYLGLGNTTNFRIAGGIGTTMPDFAKFMTMMLNNGNYNGTQIIDSETIDMMTSDQTGGVPLIETPYENDPLRENLRYGYGNWIEQESNNLTTQFGSQGVFGFTPWVDRCRNITCVFFVRKTLNTIQPIHTQLRNLVEQIIPLWAAVPTITQNGSFLQSSSLSGNQWLLNGVEIPLATNQTYTPTQNGN